MYIFTFLFLFFFSWLSLNGKLSNKDRRRVFLFLTVWLVLHDGLRWAVGTDWNAYLFEFNDSLYRNKYGLEIGYYLINQIVRFCTSSYTVFLLLHAVFLYSSMGKLFKRYSPIPILSLWLFYASVVIYMGMNRQFIAMSLLVYSIPYAIERRLVPFLIIVSVAVTVHFAAIMFLVAYLLPQVKEKKSYFIALGLACIFALSGVINKIPLEYFYAFGAVIGGKASMYADQAATVSMLNVLLGIAKRIGWILLIFTCWDTIKSSKPLSLFFNLYFISVLMYIIFNGTMFQILVQRGLLYFSIFECILLPYSLLKLKRYRSLLMLFFCIYGLWQINRGMDAFKKDMGYDIFRPYNAVYINPDKTINEKWDEELW